MLVSQTNSEGRTYLRKRAHTLKCYCDNYVPFTKVGSTKNFNPSRADPEGGTGRSGPPLEFWQKSGYQIRDWDRFDIAQHLCKLQS